MFLVELGLILEQGEIELRVRRFWQPRYLNLSHPDLMKMAGDLTPNSNHPPGVRIYAYIVGRTNCVIKVQTVGLVCIKGYWWWGLRAGRMSAVRIRLWSPRHMREENSFNHVD